MNAACFLLWTWIRMAVILSLLEGFVHSLEDRCPAYNDNIWKIRDQKCDGGKKYHCFENLSSQIDKQGCFAEKLCMQGAHPVVENEHIRCAYCETGYQPHQLSSIEFQYSHCIPHSRGCNPEFGESLCYAGTRERDRACTCSATLGFSALIEGENCSCFTQDGLCSGCKFTGCPQGSSKNNKGFCEPDLVTLSSAAPSTNLIQSSQTTPLTTQPSDVGDDSNIDLGVGLGVGLGVPLIIIIVTLIVLWKRGILTTVKMHEACCYKACRTDEGKPWITQNGSSLGSSLQSPPGTVENTEERQRMLPQEPNERATSVEEQENAAVGQRIPHFTNPIYNPVVYIIDKADIYTKGKNTINIGSVAHMSVSNREDVMQPPSGSAQGDPSSLQPSPSSHSTRIGPSTPSHLTDPSYPSPTQGGSSMSESTTDFRHSSVSSSSPHPESVSVHNPSASPPSLPEPSAPPPSLPEPSAPPPSLPEQLSSIEVDDNGQEDEKSSAASHTSDSRDERDHLRDDDSEKCDSGGDDGNELDDQKQIVAHNDDHVEDDDNYHRTEVKQLHTQGKDIRPGVSVASPHECQAASEPIVQ